jgi:hypothetical protein
VIHAHDKRLKRFIEKLQAEGSDGFTVAPPPKAGSDGFTAALPPKARSAGFKVAPPPKTPGIGGRTPPPETPGIGGQSGPAAGQPAPRWFSLIRPLLAIAFVLVLATVVVSYLNRQVELDALNAQLDNIVNAPVRDRLEQRLTYVESRLAQDDDRQAQRFQRIEQQLADNRRLYEQRLMDVEQQLQQTSEPYEGRLQDIEQQLVHLRTTDDSRFRDTEKKLLYMTARLDEWSARMAQRAGNEKAAVAVNMAMTAEPPSALLLEPVVAGRTKEVPAEPQVAASQPPRQGDWVVNIASYTGKKTAARKLAYFQKQGIAAEQVVATVNGKTIYRVQVAGFDSLAVARGNARVIGDQLGIENLWVKRR